MAQNGEGADLRASSRRDTQHITRARNAAPTNVVFDNLTITATGRIPYYIAPGVTRVTPRNSEIRGTSSSVAVYLDAES